MILPEDSFKGFTYRDALLNSIATLDKFKEIILSNACDIMMAGELKEWSDSIPEGEEFDIEIEVFEGCDDLNLQLLIQLFKEIEGQKSCLLNINSITNKELNFYKNKNMRQKLNKPKNNKKDDELPF